MKLGQVIRKLRKSELNETQFVFANGVGITQTYLSQIEGDKKTPSAAILAKIADRIKLPVAYIMWMALTEEDMPEHKREAYRSIKNAVDELINNIKP